MKSKLTLFTLLSFFSFFTQAQELPPFPWHTINITWILKNPTTEIERLDMDISIDRDITTDYFLYISPFNSTF